MRLILPEPPSANRYWRHARGKTYLSAEALAYRNAVADEWATVRRKDRKVKKLSGPIAVIVRWYRGRKSGDLDNRLKQLLDALRGWAYTDDSQIVEIHAYRYDRANDAGVEVYLSPIKELE